MLERGARVEPRDPMTPEEAIKDPFVLEFLDPEDEYSESELEAALIQHLADFLLELGDGFTFMGRQRRLRLDDTWFRVDLLLFHRRLKCLVVIDLKAGRFSHADAGQMHLYLNYAREHWMCEGENPRRQGGGGGPLRPGQPAEQGARRRIPDVAARCDTAGCGNGTHPPRV